MPTPSDEDAAATPDSDVEPSLLPSEKGGAQGGGDADASSSSAAAAGAQGFDSRNRTGIFYQIFTAQNFDFSPDLLSC